MLWTAVHLLLFFPTCYAHLWVVRVIEGKIVLKRWSEGKPRLLRVRGWFELGRFELLGVDCMCQFCQFYTPVIATTISCIFMALSRCHMSAFWPPGLILWLKRSYAPGFVISSCCFRRLLNWAKFWYRSVLNGPNIKRTPFIKRTPDYSLNEIDFVADRLEWFAFHS